MRKKVVSVILSVSLIFGMFALFETNSFATDISDLSYDIDAQEVTITGYSGSVGDVVIPEIIEGYPVTKINQFAFYQNSDIKTVTIPSTIEEIGDSAFGLCVNLTDFYVDPNNNYYLSYNGILVDKAVTTVVCFPSDKEVSLVEIPEGFTTIYGGAFAANKYIETVKIPKSVTEISESAFYYCSNIKSFEVNPYNENYTSQNGVLFSKDFRTLISYPACKQDEVYTVPNGVETIPAAAFMSASNLNELILPNTLKSIGNYAFIYTSFSEITIPKSVESIDSSAFTNSSVTTIKGVEGSVAQEFAYENDMDFEVVEDVDPNFVLGDVSGDGEIDILDYNFVLNHINESKILSGKDFKAADVDKDGSVDLFDLYIIDKCINGLTTIG